MGGGTLCMQWMADAGRDALCEDVDECFHQFHSEENSRMQLKLYNEHTNAQRWGSPALGDSHHMEILTSASLAIRFFETRLFNSWRNLSNRDAKGCTFNGNFWDKVLQPTENPVRRAYWPLDWVLSQMTCACSSAVSAMFVDCAFDLSCRWSLVRSSSFGLCKILLSWIFSSKV